jgi:cyclohexa-1,5-dienecarbonyl-CoA hydratase
MSTQAANVVRIESLENGAIWRAHLNTPRANILDHDKIEALAAMFDRARRDATVKAIVIEGEGPNFSFGASVQEHLPGECARMLSSFHAMFHAMLDASVATLAAAQPGAPELAAFCQRIASHARGQPARNARGNAPVASSSVRAHRGGADDLLLSGRTTGRRGVPPGPRGRAPRKPRRRGSPTRAPRFPVRRRACAGRSAPRGSDSRNVPARSPGVDVLDDLMRTADANEGLQAFIENDRPRGRIDDATAYRRRSRRTRGADLPRPVARRSPRVEGTHRRPRHRLHARLHPARAAARAGGVARRHHGRRR